MCGIVGFWNKARDEEHPVGATVLSMLTSLACRGPDSAGVALFSSPQAGLAVRVKLPETLSAENGTEQVVQVAGQFGSVSNVETTATYARFLTDADVDPHRLEGAIEAAISGVEIISMGRTLNVVKQVGSPSQLEATYHVSQWQGLHGIGHTRMSTESKVDLSHSQPFWAHGHPDVAIVHNGHVTNYHRLRRQYEQRGVKFYTENDSEVIAVYVGEQLSNGLTLEQALHSALGALDGSFSCIAATGDCIGYVKDPFSHKPLLVAETDEFVAIANEEIAMRGALAGDYRVREAQSREVKVWRN